MQWYSCSPYVISLQIMLGSRIPSALLTAYSKIPILRPPFGTVQKWSLRPLLDSPQKWSLIRYTLGVENEEKNNLNFANKVFNRYDVLILGGLNSEISLYLKRERHTH